MLALEVELVIRESELLRIAPACLRQLRCARRGMKAAQEWNVFIALWPQRKAASGQRQRF